MTNKTNNNAALVLTATATIEVEKRHETDDWGCKLPGSDRLFVSVIAPDEQWDNYYRAMSHDKVGCFFSNCGDADLYGDGLTHSYFVCRTRDEVKIIRDEVKRVNRLISRQQARIAA